MFSNVIIIFFNYSVYQFDVNPSIITVQIINM